MKSSHQLQGVAMNQEIRTSALRDIDRMSIHLLLNNAVAFALIALVNFYISTNLFCI